MRGMGSWDHKGGASGEKYGPEIYAGKRKQKFVIFNPWKVPWNWIAF